jgi:hypothetical protein
MSVAITLLALTVTFIYQILWNTVRKKDAIREGLEGPSIEQAILDQIMRDFRYIYYRAGQFPADAGFWGRSKQLGGKDADRVDFLTCRSSKVTTLEDADQPTGDSPVSETGYALKPNDRVPQWLELWRREDYFVDDDPTDGGRFDLLYDKVRSFELRYFPVPEENRDVKGLEEWDSKVQKKIPYALILRLEYDLKEPPTDEPQGRLVKILVMRTARSLPPEAGMAMDTGMTGMR